LKLPDSKTGKKEVMLNKPALKLLENMERKPNNPYVVFSQITDSYITDMQKPWRRIRKQAGLYDEVAPKNSVRIHDLRHSFASFAIASDVSLYDLKKMLGHKQISTTERYAHIDKSRTKEMTNKVGSTMFGIVENQTKLING